MAHHIDVTDLNIYYGDFLAVENVNISIPARSVTAFIGPSGCGKSTFLRSLNRMHEEIKGAHVDGKVIANGQDLYASTVDPVDVRRDDVDCTERVGWTSAQQQADEEVDCRRHRREVADACWIVERG